MLQNAYFLAKFRFDTAENEPVKNLQNLQNLPILPIFLILTERTRGRSAVGSRGGAADALPGYEVEHVLVLAEGPQIVRRDRSGLTASPCLR